MVGAEEKRDPGAHQGLGDAAGIRLVRPGRDLASNTLDEPSA